MANGYAWGSWEERWDKGRFSCVFVQAHPGSDGMVHATGLYHAEDGESLTDLDNFEEQIWIRTAVVCGCDGVLVRTEFAELLAIMPAFLEEVSSRFDNISKATAANSKNDDMLTSVANCPS